MANSFVVQSISRWRGGVALALALALALAVAALSAGCKPKAERLRPAGAADAQQKGEPSVYRQAIDKAKALEKQINDRAIDPGEKARLGGPDPTGQDQ
jgi:hypothetical protein